MSEAQRIHWMKRDNTPAHLWPEMVRCHCGAAVEKVGVKPRGQVVWVCENGHDDVAEDFMRRVRSGETPNPRPPDSENESTNPTERDTPDQ